VGGDEADGGDFDLHDLRPRMRQRDWPLEGGELTGVDGVSLSPDEIALGGGDRIRHHAQLHHFARSKLRSKHRDLDENDAVVGAGENVGLRLKCGNGKLPDRRVQTYLL